MMTVAYLKRMLVRCNVMTEISRLIARKERIQNTIEKLERKRDRIFERILEMETE